MKILHINFSFTQGGIDNMMRDIMAVQMKNGHQISLLIINDHIETEVLEALPNGVDIYRINRPKGSRNIYYIIKVLYYINLVIRPDVVHCHHGDIGKYIALDTHKKILTVHAMGLPTKHYHYFNHICCISEAVKKNVLQTYPTEKISVIYNGIDFSLIKRRETQNGIRKIVVVGRLNHDDKGQDIAIKGLKKSISEGGLYSLDIVGNGKSMDFLKRLIVKHKVESYIQMLGARNREWLYKHLCEYDLMIVPSRHEGFGLTILEGIAANLPVIASDIDGPKEILCNGKYGFLFKSEDPNDLANKIKAVASMQNLQLCKKIDEDYKYMKANFSIEITSLKYIQLYQTLITR